LHIWPDEILSVPCDRLDEDEQTLHEMAHAMIATMRHHKGVGLAAPQIGILKQMFVIEPVAGFPMVFINPTELTYDDEKMFSFKEGCLSIPGVFQNNKRPNKCSFSFDRLDGEYTQTMDSFGYEAFIIQHELDHLMGRLFIDDWSDLKLQRAKIKVSKYLKR
jgi:peptide deformylase